ncbi:50S ribosomal protein Mrp49, partial [Aspergillus sclerotialis]
MRTGLGAAYLPNQTTATTEYPPISRLHLTYAQKIYKGHQGSRHFWRQMLPRLKYHNPAIPMTVRQIDNQDLPPVLTVYFSGGQVSKPASLNAAKDINDEYAPKAEAGEKSAVLNLRDLPVAEIWKKVQLVTGAKDVEILEKDRKEKKWLDELDERSVKDQERVAAINKKKKDQERMLEEARKEVE